MGFHDEARKIAQRKQQRQATGAETLSERIDRLLPNLKEQRERQRSDCLEKVLKWFDEIGMLPHPRLTAEWARRPLNDPDRYDAQESYFKITWEFEGYKYRASCTSGDSEAWPYIEVWIGARWFYAGTIEAIGHAFLVVEEMGAENRARSAQRRTETPMVVLSDIWVGTPYGVGSLYLRKGSIVTVDLANAEKIAQLGGIGNLGPPPPGKR